MKREITLCFRFLCNDEQVECRVDEDLTLQEIWEGLTELVPDSVTRDFEMDQQVILCCGRDHHLLDNKKAIAELRLLDGELILVY